MYGEPVAVVAEDGDFERACEFYSELLHFPSLSALTEALLSGDGRVEQMKKVIESNPALIVEKIKEDFPSLGFYHEMDESDIEDVEVDDVTVSELSIIHIGATEIAMAFDATVNYSAYVRADDHSTAAIDSSEDFYMVLDEYRGTVRDWTEISGVAKCSVSPDWKTVQEVLMFEIQDDDIFVQEVPTETYRKGKEYEYD